MFDAFTTRPAPSLAPTQGAAESCLRSTVAALAADPRSLQRELAQTLAAATIHVALVNEGTREVQASLAVSSTRLRHMRDHVEEVTAELAGQLAHHRWTLTSVAVVASDPASEEPTAPPKKADLVAAVAAMIAEKVKSYDVADLCDGLGMPIHPDPSADPFRSKRVYVSSRLQRTDVDNVVSVARRLLDEYDGPELAALLQRYRTLGPGGAVKNLIFGSTRKPDLVITDALSNDLALVNPDEALLYNGGIPDEGLTWRRLVTHLLPSDTEADMMAAARRLYARLRMCLASRPEHHLFHAYGQRYGTLGFDQPALVPQVWLHYDPKAKWQREWTPLTRQRMDFLLLLAGRRRVVLEVDGKQHYADDAGRALPARYSQMVRADRELRLAGYEVYRFGAEEFSTQGGATEVLTPFFERLLQES